MGGSASHVCHMGSISDNCPTSPPKAPQSRRTIRQASASYVTGRRHSSASATGEQGPPRRKISSRFGGGRGVAWGLASGRIHAMNAQLIQLHCANGELVTTPDTITKAPRLVDPNYLDKSDKDIILLILNALRRTEPRLIVPDNFDDWQTLRFELRRLGLDKMASMDASPHTITLSCQAALSIGRLNPEVTFRKVVRIVVCGRVAICRDVFEEQLNEARDGDAADDKYTSRFFLKHSQLERAFDTLALKGFRMVGASTFAPQVPQPGDETTFLHHTQYAFTRIPGQVPIFKDTN
ncbi:unnamed protein product, partial [Mesorhabditis belari]|uniref:KCTD8/12/16 H1 domain-containing protein n=1 Tax=Mesorhabditis belari TaxID=2138241 RepID=A0AAF3F6I1_9BILA